MLATEQTTVACLRADGHTDDLIGGVWVYAATAPVPHLTIDGHTATISGVRYVWSRAYCGWCRTSLHLWTDGGRVDMGLKATARGARWFTTWRPASAPRVPQHCPHEVCASHRRPADHRWVPMDAWSLSARAFSLDTDPHAVYRPWPAAPRVTALMGEVWTQLRRDYPDMVTTADAYARRDLEPKPRRKGRKG